jgi:hypothetical protein
VGTTLARLARSAGAILKALHLIAGGNRAAGECVCSPASHSSRINVRRQLSASNFESGGLKALVVSIA